ncbi:hypothetical protein TWF718_009831 [Orbilia javanica]|uniref:Uncharacterized protein n=1 Tax=Orbilia javanica TaxID=47235 RepID=A0AAN8RFB2_9PEZI
MSFLESHLPALLNGKAFKTRTNLWGTLSMDIFDARTPISQTEVDKILWCLNEEMVTLLGAEISFEIYGRFSDHDSFRTLGEPDRVFAIGDDPTAIPETKLTVEWRKRWDFPTLLDMITQVNERRGDTDSRGGGSGNNIMSHRQSDF